MATVFNVACYILEKLGEMSTMKLQKLTYYCQAWSLAWDGIPLFDEDFQAWSNGPVCPELYNRHKGKFVIKSGDLDCEDYRFTKDQLETLNSVMDYYGNESPHYLSELTHLERPWKETRSGIPAGDPSKRIIKKELMQEYYSGL